MRKIFYCPASKHKQGNRNFFCKKNPYTSTNC